MDLSKFSSKAQGLLGKMSEVTQEFSEKAEQRAAERKEQKAKDQAMKEEALRLEAEEASGYYIRDGKLIISTIDGMKQWLNNLGKDTTPALMQTLQMQLQVLKHVQSPSMTGMALDNMILCLDKAVKSASSEVELSNIRESFASMIQSYFFMQEANLRCAQLKNKEEGNQLLNQAGEILSEAVTKTAQALTKNEIDMTKTIVRNIFDTTEKQQGYLKQLFSWFGNKKVVQSKEKEFYQTLEMLFETFDLHAELLGASILIKGMLSRYRKALVEYRTDEKIQMYIDRGHVIDTQKIAGLSKGLVDTTNSLIGPAKIGAISGIAQSLNSIVGLITDRINSNKKGLDIKAYCTLQDALETDCEYLQKELEIRESELQELKNQLTEIGLLQFAQKKELQEKIVKKTAEKDAIYNSLMLTRDKISEMKQMFPDSYAMKAELEKYEENLLVIENKFL